MAWPDVLHTANEMSFGTNLGRLRELKRQWDPQNLFRFPLSIEPAPSAASLVLQT
jgi:hypothetical protein